MRPFFLSLSALSLAASGLFTWLFLVPIWTDTPPASDALFLAAPFAYAAWWCFSLACVTGGTKAAR